MTGLKAILQRSEGQDLLNEGGILNILILNQYSLLLKCLTHFKRFKSRLCSLQKGGNLYEEG